MEILVCSANHCSTPACSPLKRISVAGSLGQLPEFADQVQTLKEVWGGGWDRPTREAELEQEPRMEGSATEPTPQPPPRGQAHTRAHTFPYLVQAL